MMLTFSVSKKNFGNQQSRLGLAYRPISFWLVMLDAVYQSLVVFFIAQGAYAGSDVDIWEFGTTITTSCLYTMLVHCALGIRSWVNYIKYLEFSFLFFHHQLRLVFCAFLRGK